MQNPSACDCECNKTCNLDEYIDIKNGSCKNRLFEKLVLECEDQILNTSGTILNDKKVACAKSSCLIYTISLIIICSFFISCHFR